MDRRDFFKLAVLAGVAGSVSPVMAMDAAQRRYRLTYRVRLPEGSKLARLWVPVPHCGFDYQSCSGRAWNGEASEADFIEKAAYAAPTFYALWRGDSPSEITVVSDVSTRDRSVDLSTVREGKAAYPAEVLPFLKPTPTMPIDGIVRKTALEATRGATTPLTKARAIYDWVVDNSFRDPTVRGCGVGDIKSMLETGNLGGKCADINSLFVGLARASGIPAREIFGIRLGPSRQFASLGLKSVDASKGQHCRAEFYLTGVGWVPVDPADVRKAVLEEKLALTDPAIVALRERLFGSWEGNWAGFNYARDFKLHSQTPSGALNFFMYPQAEIDSVPRDSLEPKTFVYQIEAQPLAA